MGKYETVVRALYEIATFYFGFLFLLHLLTGHPTDAMPWGVAYLVFIAKGAK